MGGHVRYPSDIAVALYLFLSIEPVRLCHRRFDHHGQLLFIDARRRRDSEVQVWMVSVRSMTISGRESDSAPSFGSPGPEAGRVQSRQEVSRRLHQDAVTYRETPPVFPFMCHGYGERPGAQRMQPFGDSGINSDAIHDRPLPAVWREATKFSTSIAFQATRRLDSRTGGGYLPMRTPKSHEDRLKVVTARTCFRDKSA